MAGFTQRALRTQRAELLTANLKLETRNLKPQVHTEDTESTEGFALMRNSEFEMRNKEANNQQSEINNQKSKMAGFTLRTRRREKFGRKKAQKAQTPKTNCKLET